MKFQKCKLFQVLTIWNRKTAFICKPPSSFFKLPLYEAKTPDHSIYDGCAVFGFVKGKWLSKPLGKFLLL